MAKITDLDRVKWGVADIKSAVARIEADLESGYLALVEIQSLRETVLAVSDAAVAHFAVKDVR